MSQFSYRDIEMRVIQWAEARKIIPNSTAIAQSRKAGEEVIELVEAAARMKALKDVFNIAPELISRPEFAELCQKAEDDFKDAVGDNIVCLINACALADVDMVDCLEGAWHQIKDRRGHMREDGIFVKESAGG